MINATYNYLPRKYLSKPTTTYPFSKKNELKKIYSNIISLNRQSPSYLIKTSPEKDEYAVGIKETAISLQSCLSSFLESDEAFATNSKVVSSQPEAATISFTAEDKTSLPAAFTLQINELASAQINTGKETYDYSTRLEPGTYNFIIEYSTNQYEFQFNIKEGLSDLTIQTKLADFINQSNINLHVEVESASNSDHSRLKMTSKDTGASNEPLFQLTDDSYPKRSQGIVNYFDLDHMASASSNASFLLNDESTQTQTNEFNLGSFLSIQLNKETDQPIQVNFNLDYDKVLGSLKQVIRQYNSFVDFAKQYSVSQKGATKLSNNLKDITSSYYNELEACGISFDSQDKLQLDESLFLQSASDNDANELLHSDHGYLQTLLNKTNEIKINPMEYVDKTIVTYPNNLRPAFPNPYITSMYSGMLFNYYC